MNSLRILHLPDLVGGMPTSLAIGETANGMQSQTLAYLDSPFGYHADIRLKRINAPTAVRWAERVQKFLQIRNAYDVFHFNFGSSLLNSASKNLRLFDLPFYPASSAKIMTYQGSDCRLALPSEIDESFHAEIGLGNLTPNSIVQPSQSKLEEIRKSVAKVARHCDQIFALNPDLLQFLPAGKTRFLPYAIEKPTVEWTSKTSPSWETTRPLHIVHLSTNRVLKGTGIIEEALKLASQKTDITYEIVVRQSRGMALAAMGRADLLIDQVILGWYGASAVEAMYHEIPVAAFISPLQKALAPPELVNRLPVIDTSARELASTIIRLNSNREILESAAKQGKIFADYWHDPVKVAKTTIDSYSNILSEKNRPQT